MARLLYRLGRWAAAHPGRVVLAWALLLVLAAVLGAGLHGQLSSVFTVPGTESQNAQNLLSRSFPPRPAAPPRSCSPSSWPSPCWPWRSAR
jgi:uncharacterized membrane protein YdfJ with MMPL/SSD domain